MKRRYREIKEKIGALSLLWILVCGALFCAGCGREQEKQEETAGTGRYTEEELELPGTGYTGMYPLEDGGYALYGAGLVVQAVEEDGTLRENHYTLWRNAVKGLFRSESSDVHAVSPAGDLVFAYLPAHTAAEYETMSDEELFRGGYLYVDAKGNRRVLKVSGEGFGKTANLEYFAFAPDGALYASDDTGKVYSVDTESGDLAFLFQAGGTVTEMGFLGNRLIGLDGERAWLYDRGEGKLLEQNELLDEFVSSHQAGAKPVILCPGEEENILYLGCRSGLYRYVWEGSVIEQIADGQFLTFGNSYYTPQSMQYLGDGRFRVFFNQNRLVECYYDETLPAEMEKTLTIYSLKEDSRIRYAAQIFQKSHPEALVKVETGAEGDNAVSGEDALKSLNTSLLAGEGPDLMVLDGMDIEQYAKKGVLMPLDDILEPYLEQELLYENIVDGMRMTETDQVYAVPMTVMLPAWEGEQAFFEGEDSLEALVEGARAAREKHQEGALLWIRDEKDLMSQLIFTSLPAWTDENGSLDQEKLRKFFEAAKELWDLNASGMTEEDWETLAEVYSAAEGYTDENLRLLMGSIWGVTDEKHIWVMLGMIRDVGRYESVWLNEWNTSKYEIKSGVENWTCGFYLGQAPRVFVGQSIVGICQKAREPELAQEFFELLLSDEIMNKWWMKPGLPVSRAALAYALDVNNLEWYQYLGLEETVESRAVTWPPEEQRQKLQDMMASYQSGTSLEEIVQEVGIQVLKETLSPEEGAAEVAKRMAIEMEE